VRRLARAALAAALAGFTACAAGGTPNGGTPKDGGPGAMTDAGAPTCMAPRAPETFDVVKIAEVGPTGGSATIRLGPDGVPIVAFLAGDPGSEQIVAVRIDGAKESDPAGLVPLSRSSRAVTPPRLASTRDGRIVGAYVSNDADAYSTRFMTWSGQAADAPVEALPFSDLSGLTTPAVIVGRDDRPIVAATYADNSLRLLSSLADGSWSRETVDIGVMPSTATQFDLTLDSGGEPMLVGARELCAGFCPADSWLPSEYGLTVWRREGGGWARDRLLPDSVNLEPRIRSSPSGEISIFFAGTAALARAVRRGGDWVVEDPLADAAGRTVSRYFTDVAFGPAGELHVAASGSAGSIEAVLDGCGWSETTIDPRGGGDEAALAVDAAGNAHVAYQKPGPVVDENGAPTTTEIWYARPRS
jgi:hypothetical protein